MIEINNLKSSIYSFLYTWLMYNLLFYIVAGAAGFEPAITGSKPDALPLGYAPIFFPFKTIANICNQMV